MSKTTICLILLPILALFLLGCEYSATIILPEEYEVRIINKTDETIRIKWDDGSYRRLDSDCVLIISSVGFGFHKIECEWDSPRRHTKSSKVYRIEIDADFEIIIEEHPSDEIIILEY